MPHRGARERLGRWRRRPSNCDPAVCRNQEAAVVGAEEDVLVVRRIDGERVPILAVAALQLPQASRRHSAARWLWLPWSVNVPSFLRRLDWRIAAP